MSDKPLDCVGIEPVKSEVGKHDFVLTRRSPESREAYLQGKLFEFVTTQSELAAVTRERDALHTILTDLVAAKDEKDANGDSPRYLDMKRGLWERARQTLDRLASGELRKAGG